MRNLLAELAVYAKVGAWCRLAGPIQSSFGRGARLLADAGTVIGVATLGAGSDRRATTILAMGNEAQVKFEGCTIGRGCRVAVGPGASLSIGRGTYVADGTSLFASERIVIGERCAISWGVTLIDDDGHGFGPPPYSSPIVVGDDVWIGCNAIVRRGVTIGDGAVVGAGAVVTKNVPDRCVVVGSPARIVKEQVTWTDERRSATSTA